MAKLKLLFTVMPAAFCLAAADAPPDPAARTSPFKVTQVVGGLYLLQGTGGNIAASVGAEGVALVDSDYAEANSNLRAALRSVTPAPVRYVFNSHYHLDHSGGNAPLAAAGATVIAHASVRDRLAVGATVRVGSAVQEMPKTSGGGLPAVGFERELTLHLNGEAIRAVHFPATHSGGDVVVFFGRANVVHMGDVFVRYGFPFIDVPAGGRIDGMIKTCETVIKMVRPDVQIIPGHGDIANLEDLRAYLSMLKDARAEVAQGIASGKSLERLKADRVLDRWAPHYANAFISPEFFVETLFLSLKAEGAGR